MESAHPVRESQRSFFFLGPAGEGGGGGGYVSLFDSRCQSRSTTDSVIYSRRKLHVDGYRGVVFSARAGVLHWPTGTSGAGHRQPS